VFGAMLFGVTLYGPELLDLKFGCPPEHLTVTVTACPTSRVYELESNVQVGA
jgi:hypothetical protein